MMKSPFKLALIQLKVTSNKRLNLQNAHSKVMEASNNGAHVAVLPECFNSPYGTKYFGEYAEVLNENVDEISSSSSSSSAASAVSNSESITMKALRDMAKQANVVLIGGSIPERDPKDGKLYNTCTIWNQKGEFIGKHRKIHLFDINVKGKISFQESKTLSPGNTMTQVETWYGKLGIGICYDMRFPELAMIAARKGCIAMIYPGAFNMTTGPLHWELILRSRAVDNQMFVAGCSPARDNESSYTAWGHSTIVNPMGDILAKASEKEEIIYAEIDSQVLNETRESIPVYHQRRFDIYNDVSL